MDDVGAAFEPDIAERRDAHAGALGNARGGRNAAVGGDAAPEGTVAPEESAEPEEAQSADAGTVDTVVYYQDNYGYLVPVQCKVPAEDGIAKATLSLMVKSTANDMQAARLGLRTVLPENMSMDLDIAGGLARIDLGKEALEMPDAAAESNMIAAIVQALTEFPTVEKVEFLIGGQRLETLPHGTSVSGQFTREGLNPEMASASIALEDAEPVTLYFPGDASDVLVPVTRMVYSEPDINTAVVELCKGPSASSPLENVLPAGCGVIDVSVEDGGGEDQLHRRVYRAGREQRRRAAGAEGAGADLHAV